MKRILNDQKPLWRHIGTSVLAIATIGLLIGAAPEEGESDASSLNFTEEGALVLPEGYRQWVFVGSTVTPNDMNDGNAAFPEFHHVYIDPASFTSYQQTGQFPEGTMLVKELVAVGSKQGSSGNGYFPGGFNGVAAAVKSAKHFPDEPGNWAYFSFGSHPDLAESASALPTASCNACHQASGAEDWVFTQYYPVLRAAKPVAEEEIPNK